MVACKNNVMHIITQLIFNVVLNNTIGFTYTLPKKKNSNIMVACKNNVITNLKSTIVIPWIHQ